MLKISLIINIIVEMAVVGVFRGLRIFVAIYAHCLSSFMIGSIGSKTSRKTKTLYVKQIYLIFFRDYCDLKRRCLNIRSRSVAGSNDA